MRVNLKQIEAFIWVADLGSFRKAAERLGTTQPNISARIVNLEKTLKIRLMERNSGSVRLTTLGQKMLAKARIVVRSAEEFIEASENKALADNILRLGVTEIIAHSWLRDFMVALKAEYPNVSVELIVDYSVNLKRELHSNAIDLVFQNGPFKRRMSGSHPLGNYPFIWVASPLLELDQNSVMKASNMATHPILTPARNTGIYETLQEHFTAKNFKSIRMMPSSTLASSLHMAIDGLGIALMPIIMVEEALSSGKLHKVNYPWVPEMLEFRARYHADTASLLVHNAANLAEEIAVDYLSR